MPWRFRCLSVPIQASHDSSSRRRVRSSVPPGFIRSWAIDSAKVRRVERIMSDAKGPALLSGLSYCCDVAVRDKLLAHLKAQRWAHTDLLNITVTGGVDLLANVPEVLQPLSGERHGGWPACLRSFSLHLQPMQPPGRSAWLRRNQGF